MLPGDDIRMIFCSELFEYDTTIAVLPGRSYTLVALRDQTIHSHALPTTFPNKGNESCHKCWWLNYNPLGCMWYFVGLLDLHAHWEAFRTRDTWRLHGPRQVLLRSPNSKYYYRRHTPHYAYAYCLKSPQLLSPESWSFWQFRCRTIDSDFRYYSTSCSH